jgi:hypothetical protein
MLYLVSEQNGVVDGWYLIDSQHMSVEEIKGQFLSVSIELVSVLCKVETTTGYLIVEVIYIKGLWTYCSQECHLF